MKNLKNHLNIKIAISTLGLMIGISLFLIHRTLIKDIREETNFRAKKLIELAKNSGADAAKFQHHDVTKYVSDKGFKSLGGKFSHQSKWEKSIFEVYKDASIDLNWTLELKKTCKKAGIDFFSSPYSKYMVDHLDPHVPAFKIGSGDVNWLEFISYIAKKKKPLLVATGATNINEVNKLIK